MNDLLNSSLPQAFYPAQGSLEVNPGDWLVSCLEVADVHKELG